MRINDRVRRTGKAQPLREQQRAFTRKRLIEAARQVFAERGYPDATVDEIASEAGASRATFYLHFKSKAELASALVEDATPFAVERYRLLDKLLASGGPSLRGKLRDWLSDWLGIWSQSVQASHALLQAAMLEPGVETQGLRQSEALVDALQGVLCPAARNRARPRARSHARLGDHDAANPLAAERVAAADRR